MYRYFELVLAMGAAWALSGIIRFTLPRNRKSPDAPYAIAVIAVFLACILDNLLRPQLIPMRILNFIYPLTRLSYLLVGPALWLYVRVLLEDNSRLRIRDLLHLIPFLAWFAYVLADPASLHPEITFGETSGANPAMARSPLVSMAFYWDLSANLSRLLYSLAILLRLRRHAGLLPDRVSNIHRGNTLSWLGILVAFYTGIYLLNSLVHVVFPVDGMFVQVVSAISRSLPAVLFVFLFSQFSEDQPILADGGDPVGEGNSGPSPQEGQKYGKSGMTDGESTALFAELTRYLEESRSFLDPELTLESLAGQMGETRHRLSEVINRESGKRFYGFINGFRLEEFRNAVKTDRYPNYTILAVAYECGFGSSSGFYSLVKKESGITPKDLVREIRAG